MYHDFHGDGWQSYVGEWLNSPGGMLACADLPAVSFCEYLGVRSTGGSCADCDHSRNIVCLSVASHVPQESNVHYLLLWVSCEMASVTVDISGLRETDVPWEFEFVSIAALQSQAEGFMTNTRLLHSSVTKGNPCYIYNK